MSVRIPCRSFAFSASRQIAIGLWVDHKTVGSVRKDTESTGEIPQLDKTIGADGKVRPRQRSVPEKPHVAQNTGNNETLVARLKTEDYPLPIFFRIGVAYDFIKTQNNRLTMALDALHPTDNVESVNVGAEYTFNEMVSLRGGYKGLFMEDPQEGLTLGGGLIYRLAGIGAVKIDYAFVTFKDLNDIQTFSFSYMF